MNSRRTRASGGCASCRRRSRYPNGARSISMPARRASRSPAVTCTPGRATRGSIRRRGRSSAFRTTPSIRPSRRRSRSSSPRSRSPSRRAPNAKRSPYMISILSSRGARRSGGLLAAVVLAAGAGCYDAGKILDQDAPSRVAATDLDNPNYAQLLVTSAIGDFECAFTQYIIATGLVGDELIDAQLSQAGWDYDRRTIFSASGPYSLSQCGVTQVPALYTPLSVARFDADKILRELQGWTDTQVANRQNLIAQAAVYADRKSV